MAEVAFMDVWQNIKAAGMNKDLETFDKWVSYLDINYQMDNILKYLTLLGYYVFAFNNKVHSRICLIRLKEELKENYTIESKEFDLKSKFNDRICNALIELGLKEELDEVLAVL